MNRLATWLLANRPARVALITATFPVPLTNLVSGALVSTVAQTAGWRAAAIDVALALLFFGGLVRFTGGPWVTTSLGAFAIWSGCLVGGSLLGRYRSVSLAIQALVIMALAGVLVATALYPDPASIWLPLLQELVRMAGAPQGAEAPGLPAGWVEGVAALMHGIIAVSLLFSVLLAMLLASLFMQTRTAEGRRAESFREIRVGKVLGSLALAALAAVLLTGAKLPASLLLVLATGLAAQGLSVVHWVAQERAWPMLWPLVLYVPLALSPLVASTVLLVLVIVGFIDNWRSFRRPRPEGDVL